MASEIDPLVVVRRAASAGFFDDLRDLARPADWRPAVIERMSDLVGEAAAKRINFYRRGASALAGQLFLFYGMRTDGR